MNHYYSANDYYKQTFGSKVYRLALSSGLTCPNRDGRAGFGGCTFCSESGSGDFSFSVNELDKARSLVAGKGATKYISYIQSYTGTYGEPEVLKEMYETAISPDDICALSIATRPDCVSEPVINLITDIKNKYNKPVYIELGLQTPDDDLADALNRGYRTEVFYDALNRLNAAGLPVIVHMILGLPGETPDIITGNVKSISSLPIHGIKLSLLHIIKGTPMEAVYNSHPERFHLTEKEIYIKTLADCLEVIPKNIVIYRITGDAPKSLLVAPTFTADKKSVLNSINKYLDDNNIVQGSKA
ncbi:MAG: TIGR01212 family radical SAM protein [Lachnospiraceae bacterium]|nr:TIGR01212 family radical SAM protein [Lachnospiraceae bacterium]